MRRLLLVSGPRDSGKTRELAQRALRLVESGISVGGVLSEATVESGRKTAYTFRSLLTGESARFAERREGEHPPGQGYKFLEAGLAFGRRELLEALRRGVDALVVDEVGPLEIEGGGLWAALPVIAEGHDGDLYVAVRPSLVQEVRARLERPDRPARVLSPGDLAGLG